MGDIMKKISTVIPCYNDANSVARMHERLTTVFKNDLPQYDYEIIFVDDRSPDDTWDEIKKVCATDPKAKGVRNTTNFGFYRNVFSSMKYGDGDAVFMIFGDMQDPPEVLPEFVRRWETGRRVVVGSRSNTYSKRFIAFARKLYYKLVYALSNHKQIEGISGFGLYDRSFVDVLHGIDDMQPVLTGIITEYVKDIEIVPVLQEKGGRAKSNLNFWGKYDGAMITITSYTKFLLRICTFIGIVIGVLSLVFAVLVVILKLTNLYSYPIGIPSVTVGMFFLGAVQLFFLGILGEYVLSINERSMKRPLVVIDERLNFGDDASAVESRK
jgi:glycosyltransferase involved in cell wall biosynthesis